MLNLDEKMKKKIREVLDNLPDWADGAVPVNISSRLGHGDVVMWIEFMPVKKYHEQGLRLWYYNAEWKRIMKGTTPVSANKDFPLVIITRDGQIIKCQFSHEIMKFSAKFSFENRKGQLTGERLVFVEEVT